jgi:transposase
VESVRNSLMVVMDETGWRVQGLRAWLWVAAAELITVYAIRRGRGFEEAAELIGKDYAGCLVRDGWGPYRKLDEARHQTCAAHLLRRCDELLEAGRGRGREIPRAVKAILLGALDLRDRRDANEIGEQDFQVELAGLQERLLAQLARPVCGTDSPQGRLLRHLHDQFDALFTFLSEPGLPATNWMAGQGLRPAVVNRKVWGGNRTWTGARHQERLCHRSPIPATRDRVKTSHLSGPFHCALDGGLRPARQGLGRAPRRRNQLETRRSGGGAKTTR